MQSNIEKCRFFENCEAPLCHLDESLPDAVWYPDEEICHGRNKPFWVRTQRRIRKVANENAGYFTVEMLSNIKAVRKGIKGIDPDGRKACLEEPYNALNSSGKARTSFEDTDIVLNEGNPP